MVKNDVPHLCFIGRWNPFHNGHAWMIKEVWSKHNYDEKRDVYGHMVRRLKSSQSPPILIMVRDTSYDEIPTDVRIRIIQNWLKDENLPGQVIKIPDIVGVYWGRDVGYEVKEVEVPEDIKGISATQIRSAIHVKDRSWVDFVPRSVAKDLSEWMKE